MWLEFTKEGFSELEVLYSFEKQFLNKKNLNFFSYLFERYDLIDFNDLSLGAPIYGLENKRVIISKIRIINFQSLCLCLIW